MLIRIALVLEIIAIICCIHCVYGKSIRWDVNAACLMLSILIVLEGINYFKLGTVFSLINLVLIYIYCKHVFKKSVTQTLVNLIIHIVILTVIEFFAVIVVTMFISEHIEVRNIVVNLLVLLICINVLPKFFPNGIELTGLNKNWHIKLLLMLVAIAAFLLLLQGKIVNGINVVLFLLTAPSIFLIVWILSKWNASQMTVEQMKNEMDIRASMQDNYDRLLANVRLRQHEYKNHLAAIVSTHYTYKTYEKLVQAQDEYCNKMQQENRYNSLLFVGDKVLAGFLYGKFQEMESDGIIIEYQIYTEVQKYSVPTYYLVEMLGVILDNAAEAIINMAEGKMIKFTVQEAQEKIIFTIRNRCKELSYAEIERMFEMGTSSKGQGRGLGLYHVKVLCQEWNCGIHCKCVEIGQDNWIEIGLSINKADSN